MTDTNIPYRPFAVQPYPLWTITCEGVDSRPVRIVGWETAPTTKGGSAIHRPVIMFGGRAAHLMDSTGDLFDTEDAAKARADELIEMYAERAARWEVSA